MAFDQLVILYVEDEPRSRRVMQMTTNEMMVAELHMFEDSHDFLKRAQAIAPKPNIVFLDIHVQPHNGFEMLDMLRKSGHFRGIPIVAMTASVMNEEIDQLRSAGFNGCIGKPIDIDTFPHIVRQILDGETVWRILN